MTQPAGTSIPSITKDDYESGIYKWNQNKCKVFLLYCNQSDVKRNGKAERRTSECEIRNLKDFLKEWLGKDVVEFKVYDNFTKEIPTKLRQEINNKVENDKYDCFIFIVLTFGVQDRIFCWDDEISITDILEPIKKEPSMACKPKVFFIQSSDESLATVPVITKSGIAPKLGEYQTKRVPHEADVFILQCILPESLFPDKGNVDQYECIFLSALMETVKTASTQLDIHQLSIKIIAAVDERLRKEQEKSEKENRKTVDFNSLPIPEVTSTLTKALYFPFQSKF